MAAATFSLGVRRDRKLGTNDSMGAIWFLENPEVAPSHEGCCTKVPLLLPRAEILLQNILL